MDFSKEKALVKRLAAMTELGHLDWKPSITPDTFEVSFRDNTVRIGAAFSGADTVDPDISVQIVNGEGEIVEVLTGADLTNAVDSAERPHEGWYRLMLTLYGAARRRAQGAEKVIDEIIKELDEVIPF